MLRAVRSCSILAAILAAIPSTVCDQLPLNGAGTVEIPVVSGNVTNTGCHEACALLQGHNHADVLTFYPELPENYTQRFYSVQQREQRPVCVAEPTSADGVALVVNVVTQSKCPFAIKSGGHSLAPGTCNRNGGLVLDLRRLNAVKVSEDAQTVSLGPGSLWGDVYSTLEPLGLTVPGGRVDSVGVGGFILGGGISFYSRKYGWAMDNVKNFEVVLPNGTLANVNRTQSSHPDLFFALRGGGSNFGVVTRFDMQAYPNDLQWGGTDVRLLADLPDIESRMGAAGETFSWTLHSAAVVASRWAQRLAVWFGLGSNTRDVIDAFIGLVAEGQSDNAAHAYIFLSWIPEVKAYLTGSTYVYSKNTPDPEVFKNFTQGRMLKTTRRLANMSSFTHEVDEMNPRDMRQYFYTSTYKLNADLISHMFDIFIDETRPFRQVVPNALVSSNYQLVSKDQIETSAKLGGNAFGLRVEDGPLFLFSVTVAYTSAEDDDRIKAMVSRIMTRAAEVGTRMNLHHRFIYPNYATVDQNVFSGFSPDSQRKLREIQQRYDPGGLFASLQPEHLGLRNTEALGSE